MDGGLGAHAEFVRAEPDDGAVEGVRAGDGGEGLRAPAAVVRDPEWSEDGCGVGGGDMGEGREEERREDVAEEKK